MKSKKSKTTKKIPEFGSLEEEANFWDTHDLTDYLDWEESEKYSYKVPSDGVRSYYILADGKRVLCDKYDKDPEKYAPIADNYYKKNKSFEVPLGEKPVKDETLTIRLQPKIKAKLKEMSGFYNISASALVRMWIVDKLRDLGPKYLADRGDSKYDPFE